MKQFILAIILMTATSSFVHSQTYKGQYMVGGNASFASSKISDGDESTTQITFNPNFGYFFANNFAGGLRVNLNSVSYEGEDSYSSTSFSPFLRYYFLPPAQRTNLFLDVSFGVGSMGDEDDKEAFNQFSITAGPAIFLTPNTALEFGVGYTSQGGAAFGSDRRLDIFGLNVGFQIHLGRSGR